MFRIPTRRQPRQFVMPLPPPPAADRAAARAREVWGLYRKVSRQFGARGAGLFRRAMQEAIADLRRARTVIPFKKSSR